jgi:hypothetical protein
MGDLVIWSLNKIRRLVTESKEQSAIGCQNYVKWENNAINSDYEFVECPCEESCWCKQNLCNGHYRIKQIQFEQFVETYVKLWIPPRARENIRNAVIEGAPFGGLQRNAVWTLRCLQDNWAVILRIVRLYNKCGLCDSEAPLIGEVDNQYEAKMWSQLYYDSIVPFDTRSRLKIIRAGYVDPERHFRAMNKTLFQDLRALATIHGLGVKGARDLDSPWSVHPQFIEPVGGQPLSRVLDKMFYSP